MGKQAKGHEDNVILFPGLVSRLVEKGMTSLKEKKYYDALTYFKQSTELEQKHPQARYGLVITNIELNRLDEAKKYAESMLHEGIGEYYDVLQVYVSLLIQLGDYQEVVDLLEPVIAEEKLPAKMAESFYHLLDFSRQMTEEYEKDDYDFSIDQEEKCGIIPANEELIQILERGDIDQQWGAIQKLSHSDSKDVQEAYRIFLKEESNHPVLKSYLLQILNEMDSKEVFEVHKFGENYQVDIQELEDVFHEKFGTSVIRRLEKVLAQKNPSLFEMIQQIWWHYLFALYPKSPQPVDISIWACALHHMGVDLFEENSVTKDYIDLYDVDEIDVQEAVSHIKEVESLLFSLDNNPT